MNSPKTVRLHNNTSGNLCIQLAHHMAATRGAMRRGPMLTPVSIRHGSFFDVCKGLGVAYEDAVRIVRSSPEVAHFKATQRVLVEDPYPPMAVEVAPAPAPVVMVLETQTLLGPVEVTAVHSEAAVAELVEALEPEPPMEEPPPPPPLPPEPDTLPPQAELQPGTVEAPLDEVAVVEPSMDMSEDELRALAARRGINVGKLKSKTAVLRALRSG